MGACHLPRFSRHLPPFLLYLPKEASPAFFVPLDLCYQKINNQQKHSKRKTQPILDRADICTDRRGVAAPANKRALPSLAVYLAHDTYHHWVDLRYQTQVPEFFLVYHCRHWRGFPDGRSIQ